MNGYAGIDLLAEPERWREVDARLAATGVTTWLPTLISAPPETTLHALRAIDPPVHLEGPFLELPGAHPPDCLRPPDPELLSRLLDAGRVAVVTLAPELPRALELVDELVRRGIVASLGHSRADARVAHAAFDRGARAVTHLFNAMAPFSHRAPGLAGAALARQDVTVQLICDGHHLADETVLLAWGAARGRLAVVSDAIAAAGEGDGSFRLGSLSVTVRDGVARREGGALAGSVVGLPEALRRLIALGVPLVDAMAAATSVPARLLGRRDVGTLQPGARADVVVLDEGHAVSRVVRAGQLVG
ncbi:MAG: amidohydrolase family protein [Thermoleophilia bacterium]|nr:amidohydrolase family protein [Thermoleophilia bacterium]